MVEVRKNHLLNTIDETHRKYRERRERKTRKGDWPDLHFHLRSLKAPEERDLEGFAECAFAMLVSWRMNSRGAKMQEFGVFKSSLEPVWERALQLREKTPDILDAADWGSLEAVFKTIKCMDSEISLVGNSKVMAHLVPNLIPPVDGRFTLGFVCGETGASNIGIDAEWDLLQKLLKAFFYPIVQDPRFRAKADEWVGQNCGEWDTSRLKIVDNLMMELCTMKITADGREHALGHGECEVCAEHFPRRHYKLVSSSDCPGLVHSEIPRDGTSTPAPKLCCDGCLNLI